MIAFFDTETIGQPELIPDEQRQQPYDQVGYNIVFFNVNVAVVVINSSIISIVFIDLIVVAISIATIIMILIRGHLVKWLGLGLWHSLCSFFLWVWLYQVHLILMMAFLESQFVFSLIKHPGSGR